MTAPFLGAALTYARSGLRVFPLEAGGKKPALRGGFHAATTNPETIKRLWRISDRNIGIPTGQISGIWVLDIDHNDHGGAGSLHVLEAEHGRLPGTRTVLTPRGGRHLWFRYTEPIPTTAGKIAPHVDTRGDGGYVVAPPSIGVNGRAYEWVGDFEHDLALAPDWLIDLARRKPTISDRAVSAIRRPTESSSNRYGAVALEREVIALEATPAGQRNDALNRAAFRLFQLVSGGELNGEHVVEHLVGSCHRNGLIADDGERAVRAAIRSAANAGLKFPRARKGAAA
jgi:hypothetical protein